MDDPKFDLGVLQLISVTSTATVFFLAVKRNEEEKTFVLESLSELPKLSFLFNYCLNLASAQRILAQNLRAEKC